MTHYAMLCYATKLSWVLRFKSHAGLCSNSIYRTKVRPKPSIPRSRKAGLVETPVEKCPVPKAQLEGV